MQGRAPSRALLALGRYVRGAASSKPHDCYVGNVQPPSRHKVLQVAHNLGKNDDEVVTSPNMEHHHVELTYWRTPSQKFKWFVRNDLEQISLKDVMMQIWPLDAECLCRHESWDHCHITVAEPYVDILPHPDDREYHTLEIMRRLNRAGQFSRLACQIKMSPELDGIVFQHHPGQIMQNWLPWLPDKESMLVTQHVRLNKPGTWQEYYETQKLKLPNFFDAFWCDTSLEILQKVPVADKITQRKPHEGMPSSWNNL